MNPQLQNPSPLAYISPSFDNRNQAFSQNSPSNPFQGLHPHPQFTNPWKLPPLISLVYIPTPFS
jgi:hypothetical protein